MPSLDLGAIAGGCWPPEYSPPGITCQSVWLAEAKALAPPGSAPAQRPWAAQPSLQTELLDATLLCVEVVVDVREKEGGSGNVLAAVPGVVDRLHGGRASHAQGLLLSPFVVF